MRMNERERHACGKQWILNCFFVNDFFLSLYKQGVVFSLNSFHGGEKDEKQPGVKFQTSRFVLIQVLGEHYHYGSRI